MGYGEWRASRSRDSGSELCLEGVDAGAESLGVEGGVDLGVVVEVDEDVAWLGGGEGGVDAACGRERLGRFPASPGDDAVGPEVEGFVAVGVGVELLGAVKADVDEGGGGIEK